MINCNWPCQKCIRVFEVIKMEPRYEICVNTVIKELKQVDSSYNNPVQVVSTSSEEEVLQMQHSHEYVEIPVPLTADKKLKARHSQAEASFDRCNNERETLAKCHLYDGLVNGRWEIKKLPTILKNNTTAILQNTGMYLQVLCATCIHILEGTGNDGLKYDFSDQGIEIRELLKRLSLQASPIDVKKIIKEDLLPRMDCIRSKVKELTAPAPESKRSTFRLLWKSAKLQMVDADSENLMMLKVLSYYIPVLDYLVELVSFLDELDSKCSNPSKTLEFLSKKWKECLNDIIKAREDNENAIHSEAWKRSWIGTLTYCGLVALGLVCFQATSVGLGSAALLCVGGTVQLYRMYTVPCTVDACKAEGEKLAKMLDKISVEGLRKLCTDS